MDQDNDIDDLKKQMKSIEKMLHKISKRIDQM